MQLLTKGEVRIGEFAEERLYVVVVVVVVFVDVSMPLIIIYFLKQWSVLSQTLILLLICSISISNQISFNCLELQWFILSLSYLHDKCKVIAYNTAAI